MPRHSDEEEDDLEILRLAALKSLHNKKDLPVGPGPFQHRNFGSSNAGYNFPHYPLRAPYVHCKSMKSTFYIQDHSMPPQRPVMNIINNYNLPKIGKIDLSEPYVPQHVAPIIAPGPSGGNGWTPESVNGYAPYVPHKASDTVGLDVKNVQLSPRSLAFVAENNDILMRRKEGKAVPYYDTVYEPGSPNYPRSSSPHYNTISPPISPVFYNDSPKYCPLSPPPKARGMITPPPKSKSRSPPSKNRGQYSRRRSMSRSLPPPRGNSPVNRQKTLSRSPPLVSPTRYQASPYKYGSRSPQYPNMKLMRGRTPLRLRNKSPRRSSRSPPHLPRYAWKSKSPSTIAGRRRSSPAQRQVNKNRPSPNQQKRSASHGRDTSEFCHSQRPRSPQVSVINRSRSRSPIRRLRARSRDRAGNGNNVQSNHRRSPYNGRKKQEGLSNNYRSRRRKRSSSPWSSVSKRKNSRSHTPDRRRDENRFRKPDKNLRKFDEYSRCGKGEECERSGDKNEGYKYTNGNYGFHARANREITIMTETRKSESNLKSPGPNLESSTDKKTTENAEAGEKKKEDMSLEDVNEDESSEESDNDGIDLFPSDDSESENEGRFKLSSSKKERDEKVPIPSFTKLGESSVPDCVKDLKDVGTSNSNNKASTSEKDHDRERPYESRKRDERFRKNKSRRSSRDRRRVNGSTISSRRGYEESSRGDDKRRGEKPMFKSTFQAVKNEVNKSGLKSSETKDTIEKKSAVQIKRRFVNKEEKNSPEKESMPEKLSSVITSSSNSGNSGKKPIHLRLGAMTNTFKPPKKLSTWSSNSDKVIEKKKRKNYIRRNNIRKTVNPTHNSYQHLGLKRQERVLRLSTKPSMPSGTLQNIIDTIVLVK